ncbi:NAD(+)--rifampin ADP-ribosyltransferase [Bradyrhizobium sp. Cp5.3]|uniref:NAD(+)--rifampin ADP-ribosyltransferase n=1 Tax=Bradyrhizobium sp. Cp5.3 TaxID=443598 RepID=UPI00040DEE9F|nr:NAD(+)--rifampin ADP-ribosyltransferase [Bradyrhizobium sp. Cp5.3]
MYDAQDPRNKRYYHGGNSGLLVGQYILPPEETGAAGMPNNPLLRKDRVYITKDIAGAMFFASGARSPIVYEVQPEGELEDDPDHRIKGISFACPKAKIIALHSVPEAVVRRNRNQMIAAPSVPKR